MKPPLSENLKSAFLKAFLLHGNKAKEVIRDCWTYGNYHANCLEDHAPALQRLRNSENGRKILEETSFSELDPRAARVAKLSDIPVGSEFRCCGTGEISKTAFLKGNYDRKRMGYFCQVKGTFESESVYGQVRVAVPK